jgi:hypothetical protein
MKNLDNIIAIDIDGVVRDLYSPLSKYLGKKIFTYEQGALVFNLFKENPDFIVEAKPTIFYSVIKKYFKCPTFISYQKRYWRPGTRRWLNKYFKNYNVIFTYSSEEKYKYYNKFKFIIEDNPNLKDFSNVILADACYNRHIKPMLRVTTAIELSNFLKNL